MKSNQQIEKILQAAGMSRGDWARSATVVKRENKDKSEDGYLWTLSSEKPVVVFDWDRWDFVKEVLLMDGMMVPPVGQVPLLDSHNRNSVDDVLGHVRDFTESTAGQYPARDGKVFFAADDKSQRTEQKVVDRHLLDGSVGYNVEKSVWIAEGTEASVNGRLFEGPLKVSYKWSLKEFSVTPVGADVLAKVRTLCGVGR
jgi:hypothetical protein